MDFICSSRETVLSSLTSGGTANVRVGGHTEIVGALVATIDEDGNDTGQLNLTTDTLDFTDLRNTTLSRQRSLSLNTRINPTEESQETPSNPVSVTPRGPGSGSFRDGNRALSVVPNSADQESADSTTLAISNSDNNFASRSMATLGTGTITVGGTTLEQDGELTEAGQQSDSVLTDINRDTQNTERELWDSRTQLSGEVTVDNEHIRNAAEAVGDAAQAVGSAVVDATQTAATAVASTAIAVGDKLFADRVYTYEELETMGFGAPELTIPADFAKKRSLTGRQAAALQQLQALKDKYGTGANDGRIYWDEVQRMAWDFENYGPEEALRILNEGIFDPRMNNVGNIDELREDVRQYNARNTAFQETTGQAADIATGGGAVRMGIQTLEEISAAAVPIVRAGMRNTTEEAVSQSDEVVSGGAARAGDDEVASPNTGPDNSAVNSNNAESAYHATNGPDVTQSILDGVNPDFLNPKSRFGKAFYIGDSGKTVTQELSHHGASSTHAIRYTINTDSAKVLDLTDPKVAKEWGYSGGAITDQTRNLGDRARENGFNVIKYNSERNTGGVNHAVLDDFDRVLTPETVVPTKD